LFFLLALRAGRLRGFVLILFSVEFQIEKAGQIAPRSSARSPSAASAIAKRHLNLAEGGLGSKQMLQGLLLVGKGILPFLLLQFFSGGTHGVGRSVHVFLEAAEFLIFLGQF